MITGWRLNRFERLLFWAALTLGSLLILARIGAVIFLTVLHAR